MIITCAAPRPAPSVAGAEQESIVCSVVTCTAAMHVLCVVDIHRVQSRYTVQI